MLIGMMAQSRLEVHFLLDFSLAALGIACQHSKNQKSFRNWNGALISGMFQAYPETTNFTVYL